MIRFIIFAVTKDTKKRNKHLKLSLASFGVMLLSLVVFISTSETFKAKNDEPKKIETSAPKVEKETEIIKKEKPKVIEKEDVPEEVIEEKTEDEPYKTDFQIEAEANTEKHPATPGKKLFDSEFKGMNYHFKGELVKTELVEGLFGNMEEAMLVKNDEGFIMVIFPNYEIPVDVGDQVEAWGPLSGDGYASSDLGVDNVVGVTGAINATRIDINGEMQ